MFDRNRVEKLLKTAPGPSPWYLRQSCPSIRTTYGQTQWVEAGNDNRATEGKTFLMAGGNILAILSMYNCVRAIDDFTILVWSQTYVAKGNTAPLHMTAIDGRQLTPLDDPERLCGEMPKGAALKVASGIIAEIDIPTAEIGRHNINFPSPICDLDEILILATSSGVERTNDAVVNECLIVARPGLGRIEVIPQDWYNKAAFDFGYQWPTRVARDLRTGCVVGDGIRMGTFMLDDSCRNVKKWLRTRV